VQQFLTTVAAGVATYVLVQQWKKLDAKKGEAVTPAGMAGLDGLDETDTTTTV